jgi:transposase
MKVVLEVGTHSRWLSQLLTRLGHEPVVANARQVRLIYAGTNKSDRLDAEALARLGRYDIQLLKPISHRSNEAHSQLALIKARAALVDCRTELINHVRGACKAFGYRWPSCDADTFHRKATLPAPLRDALGGIIDTIEQLTSTIRKYDRQLQALASKDEGACRLTQVHGVGPITALAFIHTLDDPYRFRKSRDVGAFVGLVPRQRSSGKMQPELHITKAGDPLLRRLLVQCAQHILGPFGPDCELRRFGLRLCERQGKRAKKRAVIAVARKLAILLHRLWITGETYQPLEYESERQVA